LAVPILMRRSSRASDAAVLEKLSAVGYALRVVGPADFAKIVAQPGSEYGTGRAGKGWTNRTYTPKSFERALQCKSLKLADCVAKVVLH
jgi:hypothetical protein